MKKTFCDECGAEITKENEIPGIWSIKSSIKKIEIQILAPVNTSNNTDICKHCVINTLYREDNRPRCIEV